MNEQQRTEHIRFAATLVRESYCLAGLDGPPSDKELDKCGSLMRRAGVLIRELSDELKAQVPA